MELDDEASQALQALETPVKPISLRNAVVFATPLTGDSQPFGESDGRHKAVTVDVGPGMNSPKVTKTYGRKKKNRARDKGPGISAPTPSTNRLLRTRSTSALKRETSKPMQTPSAKSLRKKRERSESPSASGPAKAPRTLASTIRRTSSTSNLKDVSRPRPRPKPKAKRTATEPKMNLDFTSAARYGFDSDLSELSSCPDSEDDIPKEPTPPAPSLPSQQFIKGGSSRPIASQVSKSKERPSGFANNLSLFVWVLIDPKTNRAEDGGQDRLWWPGKIVSRKFTDVPLKTSLFGRKHIMITGPSPDNIRSRLDSSGNTRFGRPTFVASSHIPDILESPRKRAKHEHSGHSDLEREWLSAVGTMEDEANHEEDSDIPTVREMFAHRSTASISSAAPLLVSDDDTPSTTPNSKQQNNGKGKGKLKLGEFSGNDDWEPPGPDESLEIPGELVFGREKDAALGKDSVTTKEHWAAKVQEYIPPKRPNQKGLYGVVWMSGEYGRIRRDQFYTIAEPEYQTCLLGVVDSTGGAEAEPDISGIDFSRRSPSPEPASKPPHKLDFLELPIRHQFSYAKPVLSAILMNTYVPLRHVQAEFFAGSQKINWNIHASRRGNMLPDQVDALSVYLKEWVLRSRPQKQVVDEEMPAPSLREEHNEVGQPEVGQVVGLNSKVEEGVTLAENVEQMEDLPLVTSSQPPQPVTATVEKTDDDTETELNNGSRSSSPPMTEIVPSSPTPLPPPSSLPSILDPQDSTVLNDASTLAEAEDTMVVEPVAMLTLPVVDAEMPTINEGHKKLLADQMVVDEVDTARPPVEPLEPVDPQAIIADIPFRPAPPQQHGSLEYENLHPRKKITYISDVLLVELVRQILLWRSGERKSTEIQSDEEEERLFNLGDTLLEADWVDQVMNTRLDRKGDSKSSASARGGRFRDRKPVNYRE